MEQGMEQPPVLVVVDDLFFLSKIQTTLRHMGLASQVLTRAPAIHAYLQEASTPLLAIVDLTLRTADAVALIQGMRTAASAAAVTILAFGSHVAVDTRQQALQAGADRVVAKSEFSQHLPDLVRTYIAPQ